MEDASTPTFNQAMRDFVAFQNLLAQARELNTEEAWLTLVAVELRTRLRDLLPELKEALAVLFAGPFAEGIPTDALYRHFLDPESGVLEIDTVFNNGLVGPDAVRVPGTRVMRITFAMYFDAPQDGTQ